MTAIKYRTLCTLRFINTLIFSKTEKKNYLKKDKEKKALITQQSFRSDFGYYLLFPFKQK